MPVGKKYLALREQRKGITKPCQVCGLPFGHDFKRGWSHFLARKTCSETCRQKLVKEQQKKGLTDEHKAKIAAAARFRYAKKPKSAYRIALEAKAAQCAQKRREKEKEREERARASLRKKDWPDDILAYRASVQWTTPQPVECYFEGELVTDLKSVKIA